LKKGKLLKEGKAKKVFAAPDPEQVILEFKDDLSVSHGTKKKKFKGKGKINNEFSAYFFRYLENYQIPTHFVEKIDDQSMLVTNLEIIPIRVMVRNIATGSLKRRYDIEEGKVLEYPVIEHYLKNDKLEDALVNEYHCFAFGLSTPEEMRVINRMASKVNAILRSFFERRGLLLVDFQLEFGKKQGSLFVADEITPDTCRIWDRKSGKKFGADRFRNEMGNVLDSYKTMAERVLG